jgi:hypothetical protein
MQLRPYTKIDGMFRSATKLARCVALSAALALLGVWLVGSCAALNSSIHAARHACCKTQKVAGGCATLCNASHLDVLLSAAQGPQPLVDAGAPGVVLFAAVERTALTIVVRSNHSPPLYLQHASLLI